MLNRQSAWVKNARHADNYRCECRACWTKRLPSSCWFRNWHILTSNLSPRRTNCYNVIHVLCWKWSILYCIVSYRVMSCRVVFVVSSRDVSYRIVSHRSASHRHRIESHRLALHRIASRCIILYFILFFCILLYFIVFYCILFYFIALRCVALRCVAFRCVALHCTALYCIMYVVFAEKNTYYVNTPLANTSLDATAFPWFHNTRL